MDEDTTNESAQGSAAALMTIIEALKPLNSEDRHRAVNAAMTFLGERASQKQKESPSAESENETDEGDYPEPARKWMAKHEVSAEELDQTFHFENDGTFALHDAPGKSKREKTLNTYILTGLGTYLATGERDFGDAAAREFCETVGCYDQPHHAKFLKGKGAEYSGDKKKGYRLTNVGMKAGADIVKEIAGTAQ